MSHEVASEPPVDDSALRQQLYGTTRTELLERQFSNSTEYDKAVITLSSGFLALSLTFLKDILPHSGLSHTRLLYCSWITLAGAIVLTVVSFLVSNAAISEQLERAWRYYMNREEQALEPTLQAKAVGYLNAFSGTLFVAGVALTIWFVTSNFKGEDPATQSNNTGGPTRLDEGHVIPPLQNVSVSGGEERGQPVPRLPQVPQVQAPAPPPAAAPPAAPTATPTQTK